MHDPLTLAFRFGPIEIWHRDPCTDGSDSSCRHKLSRISARQREAIESFANFEAREQIHTSLRAEKNLDDAQRFMHARSVLIEIERALRVRLSWRQVRMLEDEISRWKSSFCFLPGYHSNSTDPAREFDNRKQHCSDLYRNIARMVMAERRSWWPNKRWHVHHWRVRVVTIARLWRKLTLRCSHCRERFAWSDWKTEGAIRHFWESSAHARCCDKAQANRATSA
jgi:hypothetical protein